MKKVRITHNVFTMGALMSSIMLASATRADDVEVYLIPPESPVPPNILFILDKSTSMGDPFPGATDRMQALKDSMEAVIDDPDLSNINAAIMSYGGTTSTNKVVSDFIKLDTLANRTLLKTKVNSIVPSGGTPSVDALQDGVKWFDTGWTDNDGNSGTSPLDPVYYCAANSIVFLTDGSPNSNFETAYNSSLCDMNAFAYYPDAYGGNGGLCAQEIAAWGESNDLRPWTDKQNIISHTVSMIASSYTDENNFLRAVARRGHGYTWNCSSLSPADQLKCMDDDQAGFFLANNTADLTDALKSAVQVTLSTVSYSYNTPTIPVSPADAASSGDYLYLPMLVPTVKGAWKGNLKKYKLKRLPSGDIQIVGDGGAPVLDANNEILATAKSFWDVDSLADGDEPLSGGVVEKLAQDYQQIADITSTTGLTDYDDMLKYLSPDPKKNLIRRLVTHFPSAPADLTDDANRIVPSNDPVNWCSNNHNITPAMFGVASTEKCHEIIEWLVTGSYDTGSVYPPGDPKAGEPIIDYKFGAPIHTNPVVLKQGSKETVFLTGSDGMLHAFDADDGRELWAFMPVELMQNGEDLKTPVDSKPIYGLDGNITVVHDDQDKNYQIDPGETIKLVFGQRRGGKNYYAIDVADPLKPIFSYKIEGGSGVYAQMGQSWSQPVYTILDDGHDTPALIFGGGYDADQDSAPPAGRVSDDEGTSIYIINALTGAPYATLHDAAMKNSIPARVSVMDMDSDGMTDRIYAADVGGRIIRADIDTSGNTIGVIADVGAAGGIKFFNQPTIAYEGGAGGFLAISVGSGNRAEPLAVSNDSFFMIKDRNVWNKPISYTAVTTSDLFSIPNSTLLNSYTPNATQKAQLKAKEGWKFDLPSGVKVFSTARVLDYVTIFTTYSETNTAAPICDTGATNGHSELYALNMLTGGGVFKNSSGDRVNYSELNISVIPPSPVIIGDAGVPSSGPVPRPAMNDILVGLEKVISFPPRMYQLNWEEVIKSATP